MDKNTLSNYGWIVIAVLVLSVMIALATPFGSYIERAINNSTDSLFETNNSVINVAYKSAGVVPKIIEGAGQVYNTNIATTPLTFRSSAKFDTFQEVRIDGEIVDSENYTVTEGSTIITFTDEYAGTLTQGNHTIDIVSSVGTATCDFISTNPFTTLTVATWNGLTNFDGNYIWTDNTSVYFSKGADQYILNKETNTWEPKTWNGFSTIYGNCVWTDGINTYHSNGQKIYILNDGIWEQATDVWLPYINGYYIWTDGNSYYYASGSESQYIFNNNTYTWEDKIFNNTPSYYYGNEMWTDGTNTYCSRVSQQHILQGDTWVEKEWSGLTEFYGHNIWTDGSNIYYSEITKQYVLQDDTWVKKEWNKQIQYGGYIWTDGTNYYYSRGATHYILS